MTDTGREQLKEQIARELWRQIEEDFRNPLAPEHYGKTEQSLMLERADRILLLVAQSPTEQSEGSEREAWRLFLSKLAWPQWEIDVASEWVDSHIARRAPIAGVPQTEQPLELNLCESEALVLRPDKLYRFTVDLKCSECVRIARIYDATLAPDSAVPLTQSEQPSEGDCIHCGEVKSKHLIGAAHLMFPSEVPAMFFCRLRNTMYEDGAVHEGTAQPKTLSGE